MNQAPDRKIKQLIQASKPPKRPKKRPPETAPPPLVVVSGHHNIVATHGGVIHVYPFAMRQESS